VLAVIGVAVVYFVARDAGHGGSASRAHADTHKAPPRPSVSTLPRLPDLRVHEGSLATLHVKLDRHRAAGERVCILITTPGLRTLQTLYLPKQQPAGSALTLSYRAALAPGTYGYHAATVDATGRLTTVAHSGRLVVLQPLHPPFPTDAGIAAACEFAAGRSGRAAVAVVDRYGRLHGYQLHAGFESASLIKVMLLIAYLREHPDIPEDMLEPLTTMIEHSDNAAAYAVYEIVGDTGLRSVARLAQMEDFAEGPSLLAANVSAADYAELMYNIRTYLPPGHEAFAMNLLSHIAPEDYWGLPVVAQPYGWTVWFKGGWLGANTTIHQVALLQKDGVNWALAVLTDGDPDPTYGIATLQGVMSRLLGVGE